jgi:hypothetical protein
MGSHDMVHIVHSNLLDEFSSLACSVTQVAGAKDLFQKYIVATLELMGHLQTFLSSPREIALRTESHSRHALGLENKQKRSSDFFLALISPLCGGKVVLEVGD